MAPQLAGRLAGGVPHHSNMVNFLFFTSKITFSAALGVSNLFETFERAYVRTDFSYARAIRKEAE